MTENDDFVRQYAPFVEEVVRVTRLQLRLTGDQDDLLGFGYAGLLDARQRFEPERGVPFKRFAYYRVRGAIVNGARKMSGISRSRAAVAAAEVLDDRIETVLASRPVFAKAGTLDTLRTISDALGRASAAYAAVTALVPSPEPSPELAALQRERTACMLEAVRELPERERRLIEGHYLHDRPLDEVTTEIGWSRSGGKSAHQRALALLRDVLARP